MKQYLFPVFIALLSLAVLVLVPLIVHHTKAFFKDVAANFKSTDFIGRRGLKHQAGFVTLLRPYFGYAQGTVVELPASTEATLIAAGRATTSAGPATSGAVSCDVTGGSVTFAPAASSLVVTNRLVTPQSIIFATIAQAAADGTMLHVARVVPANGSFTIYGNAAATAATIVDWAIIMPNGTMTNPT